MSGTKSYRPWSPEQSYLFPPSPRDWLPEGHLVYFILDVVKTLDLTDIERRIQQQDPRGNRPYPPAMMVALLLYAYCVGIYSSRKIERAIHEDVAFRVLAGGEQPFFTTINEFRRRHLKAFRKLFLQVLQLCRQAGLVKLGHVAIDGTKVAANASKHKAMSYGRMKELESRLKAEIDALLARAEAVDQEEDARWGEGQREEDLPQELRRRESRLERLREAKAALEAEARQARREALRQSATKARKKIPKAKTYRERRAHEARAERCETQADQLEADSENDPPDPPLTSDGLRRHRVRTLTDGTPHPQAQRNFVDPDSRIQESGGSFLQGYNCQLAVDEANQIILAQAVTNQSPDNANLVPMVDLIKDNCSAVPSHVTADAGYWTPEAPETCQHLGTQALISTHRRRHWDPQPPESESPSPEHGDARELMRWKLCSRSGRAIYARRKWTVEPVNGQIKQARGFRRFSLRGLRKVQAEWDLVTTAHNLLKLFVYGPQQGALTPA